MASGTAVDLAVLASARLLVAVIAVEDVAAEDLAVEDVAAEGAAAGEVAAEGARPVESGVVGDKGSHMAVVSMINAAGEKGLLAFTGLDAMQAWDRLARPVPVPGADAARAALADGATALVIDVQGPARLVVAGDQLRILADWEAAEPSHRLG